jgi:hypothetical protein
MSAKILAAAMARIRAEIAEYGMTAIDRRRHVDWLVELGARRAHAEELLEFAARSLASTTARRGPFRPTTVPRMRRTTL